MRIGDRVLQNLSGTGRDGWEYCIVPFSKSQEENDAGASEVEVEGGSPSYFRNFHRRRVRHITLSAREFSPPLE